MQGLSDGAAPQLLSRGQRGYGTIVLVRCIQCILVDMTLDAPKIVQYTPLRQALVKEVKRYVSYRE